MDNKYNDENRTHRRLKKAYCQLLSQKNHKLISVKELTDCAEMSRAGFYLHFDSIEDFSYQCSQYLIRKITSQIIFWLSQGKENLEKNCKKQNLLLTQGDRELFCHYVKQEMYFPGKSSFDTLAPMYYEFFAEKFSLSAEQCSKNKEMRFFIRALSASIMDTIVNYDSKKTAREISYVYLIWEKLFPEYKL